MREKLYSIDYNSEDNDYEYDNYKNNDNDEEADDTGRIMIRP